MSETSRILSVSRSVQMLMCVDEVFCFNTYSLSKCNVTKQSFEIMKHEITVTSASNHAHFFPVEFVAGFILSCDGRKSWNQAIKFSLNKKKNGLASVISAYFVCFVPSKSLLCLLLQKKGLFFEKILIGIWLNYLFFSILMRTQTYE